MKLSAMFIVSLLMAMAASSVHMSNRDLFVETEYKKTTCGMMNPFMQQLTGKNEGIPEPIDADPRICDGLWNKTKTCCDYHNMTAFAKQDSEDIITATNDSINDIKLIQQRISENHLLGIFMNEESIPFLDIYAKKLDPIVQSLKNCSRYVRAARKSAVCSYCSANSSIFFEGGRALISKSQCNGFLNHCFEYLRAVVLSTSDLKTLVSVILTNDTDPVESAESAQIIRLARIYEKYINQGDLITLLDSYQAAKDSGKEFLKSDFKNMDLLCRTFFSLLKTPLIITVKPLFTLLRIIVTKHYRSLIKKYKPSLFIQLVKSKSLGKGARSLQQDSPFSFSSGSDIFQSDSAILFGFQAGDQAVDIVSEMPSSIGGGYQSAMNLSITFP